MAAYVIATVSMAVLSMATVATERLLGQRVLGRRSLGQRFLCPPRLPSPLSSFSRFLYTAAAARSSYNIKGYTYKGHDAAAKTIGTIQNESSAIDHDEIQTCTETRHEGPVEACWQTPTRQKSFDHPFTSTFTKSTEYYNC